MTVTAIVGANWGDEAKVKPPITWLPKQMSSSAFKGNNAGHTVINDYGKLSFISCRPVFYRTWSMSWALASRSISRRFSRRLRRLPGAAYPTALRISDRAQVILPFHLLLDEYEEERLDNLKIRLDKTGNRPLLCRQICKLGVQVADLYDEERLLADSRRPCPSKTFSLSTCIISLRSTSRMSPLLCCRRPTHTPFVCDTLPLLHGALAEGKRILVEGQLGALRDPITHLSYPTSSSTLAGFASVGAGIPPYAITRVVAVAKAYSSCVGAGPFVTDCLGPQGMNFAAGEATPANLARRPAARGAWAGSTPWPPVTAARCRVPRR